MLKAYDNVGLVLYYDVKGSWTFWVNYGWKLGPLFGVALHSKASSYT
jgi:hypothetical protein